MKEKRKLKSKRELEISQRHIPSIKNKSSIAGITLIALVLTIIVLLIFAGVSIAMLTGDNGILTQASSSKILNEISAVKEVVALKKNEMEINENTESLNTLEVYGTEYTNENPYGPINIWGYDTVFGEGWYKLSKEDLKEMGISNAEYEYVVNYNNGYVISTEKFDYNGEDTYTTDAVTIQELKSAQCTYILRSDGTLWATGDNAYGQLGIGSTENKNTFQQVKISNIKEIYSNTFCTFAKTENNEIYAWGRNNYGQLGLGDTKDKLLPTKLEVNDVKEVYSYRDHNFLIKNDGKVYAAGWNKYGQLGLGDNDDRLEFTQVDIDNVEDIKLGAFHTILLKGDGTVWTTGHGAYGELGLGNDDNKNFFTKTDLTDVKQIINANEETIVLKNDGTVWGCGRNRRGTIGLGNTKQQNTFQKALIDNIKELKGNYQSIIAINNENKLYCWGYNESYQFGLGYNTNILTPQELSYDNLKEIYSVGIGNTFILKKDNTLWGCGYNSTGRLGQGNYQEYYPNFEKINFIK